MISLIQGQSQFIIPYWSQNAHYSKVAKRDLNLSVFSSWHRNQSHTHTHTHLSLWVAPGTSPHYWGRREKNYPVFPDNKCPLIYLFLSYSLMWFFSCHTNLLNHLHILFVPVLRNKDTHTHTRSCRMYREAITWLCHKRERVLQYYLRRLVTTNVPADSHLKLFV